MAVILYFCELLRIFWAMTVQVPGTKIENVFSLNFLSFYKKQLQTTPNLSEEHVDRLLIFSSNTAIHKHTFNLAICLATNPIFISPTIKIHLEACKRDSVNKT